MTSDEIDVRRDNNTGQSTAEDGDNLVDITSLLESCAASLTFKNPMVCNEKSFSLHDSMSALEIKDPKMDCCEIPASAMPQASASSDGVSDADAPKVPPRPLPTGLDDDVDPLPWDDLCIPDAADIVLESLTLLEAMFSGASVAESTYTCLYAHSAVLSDMRKRLQGPTNVSLAERFESLLLSTTRSAPPAETLAQLVVYASTLAMVEISEGFRGIVLHADIYEGEDFSTSNYGLEFAPERDEEGVIDTILDAIKLTKEVKEAADDDVRIIQIVLHFQLELLTACKSLASLTPEKTRHVVQVTKTVIQSGIQQLTELQTIATARKTGSSEAFSVLKRSFDPFLYRILVGNAPIRKVSFRRPTESIKILRRTMVELDWVCCDLLMHGTSVTLVRRMLSRMSASLPPVNILSRSLIVLVLYFGEQFLGQSDLVGLVRSSVKQASEIPDAILDCQNGKAFLGRLSKPVYDTLKLLALNRNRQQGYMEVVMLPDWVAIQQEAQAIDATTTEEQIDATGSLFPFFSHYVLSYLVWLVDHHVALSVELNLVQTHHDLAVAYWYRDFLLSTLLNTVSAMRRVKDEARQRANLVGSSKSRKLKSKKGIDELTTAEDMVDDFDFSLITLKRNLCRGIARFIAALHQANLLQHETYEFTSHEIRFQRRYAAFAQIASPPPLTYDDFRQGSDHSTVSQEDLLSSTMECFKTSKTIVDGLIAHYPSLDPMSIPISAEELQSLARVCVGNSVYAMRLSQMVSGGREASGAVSFDLETNKQFCIIKIA